MTHNSHEWMGFTYWKTQRAWTGFSQGNDSSIIFVRCLGFTALQHSIGYIASVSVWVSVPSWWSCTTQLHWRGCTTLHPGEWERRVPRGHTILHSRALGVFCPPSADRGQIRHYDITRNLSNSVGEYAVWMRVSACRCPRGFALSSSGWIVYPTVNATVRMNNK